MTIQQPIVIGHRGAAGEAPENTLASFELALRQGADAIELDVHLSADGEVIVCHDHTVGRTTDGTGAIAELTVAELMRLDAGRWFDERFTGERLPLLEEVFQLVPSEIMINVEVKCSYTPRLAERLAELLAQYNRLDSVVVSSFNHKVLKQLQEAIPNLRAGLLYVANFVSHRQMAAAAEGLNVYSIHPQHHTIDAGDAAEATGYGLRVYPWTVNEPQDLRRIIDAGVSGIITDFPGRLRNLLNEEQA
ncbi:glycerophosphodiester phosphodiesterase [Paenibacillus elgii]|uniref:Glycerophosphodiester phosphodiesterase n=1 Tax=Paenibacillus elgii TaxID=189691 RepID=A0A165PEK8_9BACL|nr:glycerophosphodiester phosphodiesterase [Paenibacillus elgii]KZE70455.1 glycerophosphodiester phosphodiesterase [Paenibacillus elgii]